MKLIRKRFTYSNVMSTIAVFLVLGGATALAAQQLGKKSVGTPQLKANAVTTAKLKANAVTRKKIKNDAVNGAKVQDGSLSGADINLATLGTVPSAATANSLAGRITFRTFTGPGTHTLATFGPFTVQGSCVINNGGLDEFEMQMVTAVNGATFDSDEGDELEVFNVTDNPAEIISDSSSTGSPDINSGAGLVAVAPDGSGVQGENYAIAANVLGRVGQCLFVGAFSQLP